MGWGRAGSGVLRIVVVFAGVLVACALGAQSALAVSQLYWAAYSDNAIGYAYLDGSIGGNLPTAPVVVGGPYGTAIDPARGQIYWPNLTDNTIRWANLDGSGGGTVKTTGATVRSPNSSTGPTRTATSQRLRSPAPAARTPRSPRAPPPARSGSQSTTRRDSSTGLTKMAPGRSIRPASTARTPTSSTHPRPPTPTQAFPLCSRLRPGRARRRSPAVR
jgi:hypothetical protein